MTDDDLARVPSTTRAIGRARGVSAFAFSLVVLTAAVFLGGPNYIASSARVLTGTVKQIVGSGRAATELKSSAVIQNADPPEPASTVRAVQTTVKVKRGRRTSVDIRFRSRNASSARVTLATESLPPGVSVRFLPPTGTATFPSLAVITTNSSTPIGAHVIAFTATSGADTQFATFTVIVH